MQALPDLNKALDSIEELGKTSPLFLNSGWLLLAFAKILGPSALPRLQRMAMDPKLVALAGGVDCATALCLDLTSYVSSRQRLSRRFHCGRTDEPRDTLNQFILAWQRGESGWFVNCLDAAGRDSLEKVLARESWEALHYRFWPLHPAHRYAVGYRFKISGPWGRPEETLAPKAAVEAQPEETHASVETIFVNGNGVVCGKSTIAFSKTAARLDPGHLEYLVDTPDILSLLELLASCARP